MTAASKRLSAWGIASLVMLVGWLGFGEYNLYQYDHTGRPRLWFTVYYQICVVVLLAAAVCGVIAMRGGSKWWALTVAPALLFAVLCYFGDL